MTDDIDKEKLYGKFDAGRESRQCKDAWRDALAKKAAHKALDIDDLDESDPMQVKVDNSGMKARDLAAVAAIIASTGAAVFFVDRLPRRPKPIAPAEASDNIDAGDNDTKNTIRFLE